MNRAVICISIALTVSVGVGAQRMPAPPHPPLTDKQVEEAIVLGKANKLDSFMTKCTAEKSGGALGALGLVGAIVETARNWYTKIDLQMFSAPGLIATSAREATLAGQPFTSAGVSAGFREAALYIRAIPRLPDPNDEESEAVIPSPIRKITIVMKRSNSMPTIELTSGPEPAVSPRTWKHARSSWRRDLVARTRRRCKIPRVLPTGQ